MGNDRFFDDDFDDDIDDYSKIVKQSDFERNTVKSMFLGLFQSEKKLFFMPFFIPTLSAIVFYRISFSLVVQCLWGLRDSFILLLTMILTMMYLNIEICSKLLSGFFFLFLSYMSVNVHRCLNVCMAQSFLYFFDGCSSFKEQ